MGKLIRIDARIFVRSSRSPAEAFEARGIGLVPENQGVERGALRVERTAGARSPSRTIPGKIRSRMPCWARLAIRKVVAKSLQVGPR